MDQDLTARNLTLHRSQKAIAAYTGDVALRSDEQTLIREYFPPPPARLLDLGVGNGRTTVPLAHLGYDVVGIEFCRELVVAANATHPDVRILEGDARQLQFDDNTFDAAVFSWNGIDYMYPVSDRRKVLEEVWRVVRPGGLFLVSSHNAWGCIGRLVRSPFWARRALGFWVDQLRALKHIRAGYFYWRDPALGMPLFFSARPSVQRRILHAAGWNVIAVRSVEHPDRRARTFSDVHVQYVCRKPERRGGRVETASDAPSAR